jgi:hypothetical protein
VPFLRPIVYHNFRGWLKTIISLDPGCRAAANACVMLCRHLMELGKEKSAEET